MMIKKTGKRVGIIQNIKFNHLYVYDVLNKDIVIFCFL